jgi:hypothetical protein
MGEFEKWVARVLLLNSALTLGVVLGLVGPHVEANELPVLVAAGMLGLVSGLLSLRGKMIGLYGGMLYYAVQLFGYYPYGPGWSFSVKAGLSIGILLHLQSGLFVLNAVALVLLAATAWVWSRRRAASA